MDSARNLFGARSKASEANPNSEVSEDRVQQKIELDSAFFIDLGCATWKLYEKMFDRQTGEAHTEFRQLARHVTTIRERLGELGLQIQDHTGKPFDSGQSLEVLAFQPTDGIAEEAVVETVRPTLYFRERRILKGQVIVGTPVKNEGSR